MYADPGCGPPRALIYGVRYGRLFDRCRQRSSVLYFRWLAVDRHQSLLGNYDGRRLVAKFLAGVFVVFLLGSSIVGLRDKVRPASSFRTGSCLLVRRWLSSIFSRLSMSILEILLALRLKKK